MVTHPGYDRAHVCLTVSVTHPEGDRTRVCLTVSATTWVVQLTLMLPVNCIYGDFTEIFLSVTVVLIFYVRSRTAEKMLGCRNFSKS